MPATCASYLRGIPAGLRRSTGRDDALAALHLHLRTIKPTDADQSSPGLERGTPGRVWCPPRGQPPGAAGIFARHGLQGQLYTQVGGVQGFLPNIPASSPGNDPPGCSLP
jgi:hypothetical protein